MKRAWKLHGIPWKVMIAAAGAAACLALAGCGFGLEPTLTLITDRAEMAAYVDVFNATRTDVRVEMSYQESPSQAVLDGVAGDLVIGSWLATPAVMDRLDGLGDIVKPGKLEPSWFYRSLLSMGSRDNRPFLVPLSFSLPAVVFLPVQLLPTELPAMFMPLDTLRSLSGPFNKSDKSGNLVQAGFSPSWNGSFLTETALLFGARFRPGRGGLPQWDENGLKKTVDFVHSWLVGVNGGPSVDAAFARRTALVQPWYKLLTSQKVRFALASFTALFALPEDKRHDFDYRWLSQDGLIPVMDDVLFGGVLRSSRNKAAARSFLLWFASPAAQESLLATNQSLRIGVFGVTNGFSALKSINERDLPQRYPLLIGHIPGERLLVFPETLPDDWLKVRGTSESDGVIWPWIMAAATDPSTKPLDKTLQDWQNAQKK